jgi:hypothetical protein
LINGDPDLHDLVVMTSAGTAVIHTTAKHSLSMRWACAR